MLLLLQLSYFPAFVCKPLPLGLQTGDTIQLYLHILNNE